MKGMMRSDVRKRIEEQEREARKHDAEERRNSEGSSPYLVRRLEWERRHDLEA